MTYGLICLHLNGFIIYGYSFLIQCLRFESYFNSFFPFHVVSFEIATSLLKQFFCMQSCIFYSYIFILIMPLFCFMSYFRFCFLI